MSCEPVTLLWRSLCVASVLIAVSTIFAHASARAPDGVYEDDRIQLAIPSGWSYKQATLVSSGDRTDTFPIGAVLSSGSFRVYLLTHYSQVSGVIGGRFGEISQYVAPWLTCGDPWCCSEVFSETITPVTGRLSRVDLFLNPKATRSINPDCAGLHSHLSGPAWTGSYFGAPAGKARVRGYFLNFPLSNSAFAHPDRQMVFTATVDANTPSALPAKNDPAVRRFLIEASQIIAAIGYK